MHQARSHALAALGFQRNEGAACLFSSAGTQARASFDI